MKKDSRPLTAEKLQAAYSSDLPRDNPVCCVCVCVCVCVCESLHVLRVASPTSGADWWPDHRQDDDSAEWRLWLMS